MNTIPFLYDHINFNNNSNSSGNNTNGKEQARHKRGSNL